MAAKALNLNWAIAALLSPAFSSQSDSWSIVWTAVATISGEGIERPRAFPLDYAFSAILVQAGQQNT